LRQRLEGAPVRWVAVENIHLTVKFLGDVSLANLDLLKRTLQSEAASHAAFEVSVGGVGAFPDMRRPRVIWVGVQAPPQLSSLQSGIDAQMSRLGYAREERPFSPHLTLGRVARAASLAEVRRIGEVLQTLKIGFLGATRLHQVHLYRSDLQPSGAVYTRVFSAPLGG